MRTLKKHSINYILLGLFILFSYLAIRWSDIPIWGIVNCRIMNILFVHRNVVDTSMLNIVTGYMTGYWVYFLTVFIPERKRNKPIKKLVLNNLSVLYQNSVYLLLLMCKNCCTEQEWISIHSNTTFDIECLNHKFLDQMKKFDIKSNADTIFLHRDTKTPLYWYEYLYEKYNALYTELNELFLQYHMYLDDEIIDKITKIKNSKYLDVFVGKGYRIGFLTQTHKDDIGYYESFPITMSIENTNLTPFFENSGLLKEHIDDLKDLYHFLIKYKKKHNLEILHKDYAISKLRGNEAGHYNTSVFKYHL